ncbi:ATP-binding protein [Deinococcus sonorensis]|uniref:histidine kinase n=2 Tax=Deinococcus sonorensis TaxID=309891 RepID=A0AAU7U4E5_9DEIO
MSQLPPRPPVPSPAASDTAPSTSTAGHVEAWARVTRALGEAATPHQVILAVVHEGIQALGADGGTVALPTPDGQALQINEYSGYDARAMAPWRTLPLTLHTPSTAAFQQQRPLFIEEPEQAGREYPSLVEMLQRFSGSMVALPLLAPQRVLGVLLLTFTQQRHFDATDRTFLIALAGQCAQALERSEALQQARQLNEQLSFLAQASEVLSSSLNLDETLDSIARLMVPRLTDWCAIYLPAPDGLLHPVTVVHQDPSMVQFLRQFIERNPVHNSPDNGTGRVFITGEPELVPVITDEMYDALPQSEDWKDDVRRLQLRSVITVPMTAGGRVVGVLGLARTSLDRVYGPEDVAFALEVAGRAGYAVENARLYGQAQQELQERQRAQQELDAANTRLEERVRERTAELETVNGELEAFTHSASHDLRTPLRHVVSFADLLERHQQRQESQDERSRMLLGQIQQAARRMNASLDGLLTLSRASRMPLEFRPVDLAQLMEDTIEALRPETEGREVSWDLGPLPPVDGDATLLRLVVQNLLGNAVKYTRPRDRAVIRVTGREEGERVVVSIEDNGVGFDPQYADRLFGAFQRLHHPQQFEGTGIGLTNVRRIVTRHGGQIWAEGRPEAGATFSFSLPRTHPGRND